MKNLVSISGGRISKINAIFSIRMHHKAEGGVASLTEGAYVPLMQEPLLFRAGICNLFMMPTIARLLFAKDTVGYLMFPNECWQTAPHLTSIQGMAQPLMNHPIYETLG